MENFNKAKNQALKDMHKVKEYVAQDLSSDKNWYLDAMVTRQRLGYHRDKTNGLQTITVSVIIKGA